MMFETLVYEGFACTTESVVEDCGDCQYGVAVTDDVMALNKELVVPLERKRFSVRQLAPFSR